MLKKVTLKDLDLIDSIEKTCFPSQEAASKDSLKGRLEVYPEGFWAISPGPSYIQWDSSATEF